MRSIRRVGLKVTLFLAVLALVRPAQAGGCDWRELIIREGQLPATQATISVDIASIVYLASVSDGLLRVNIIGPSFQTSSTVSNNAGDPAFDTNSGGVTFLSFSHLKEEAPAEGRDVFLTQNPGGAFAEPLNVSDNRLDDFAGRLMLDRKGDPHLVWAQRVTSVTRVMHWFEASGMPVEVGVGRSPALFVTEDDVAHVVYARGNDLYYNSNSGGTFSNEVLVAKSPQVPEASASIGVDPLGTVVITYESNNALYFAVKQAGEGFAAPEMVEPGGVLDPQMQVDRDGVVVLVYVMNGDLFARVGTATDFGAPVQITDSKEIESAPSVARDLGGNLHVSFLRDGKVIYATNTCTPIPRFAADQTNGEAPLQVRFTDLSTGDIQRWEWDFGDGGVSTQRNPEHTYRDPGQYSATLRVFGPGGVEAFLERKDYINVQDPSNKLEIPDQQVLPAQTDVWFPVFATHPDDLQGFQIMGTFDARFFTMTRSELDFTPVEELQPELYEVRINIEDENRNGELDPGEDLNESGFLDNYFEIGCIFDFVKPFDGRVLPAESKHPISQLVFDVLGSAPQGETTRIELKNDRRVSRIFNIFAVNGDAELPALCGADVYIRPVVPPFPRKFIRGDVNGDGGVNVADPIGLLNFLFAGGTRPPCMDAADFRDNGQIDISGAIALLNFLFLGGVSPAVPFPNSGLDPTDDDPFGECLAN